MVFCNNPHFVFLKSPFTPKLNPEKHIVNLANTYETILFDFYKDLSLKKHFDASFPSRKTAKRSYVIYF